jgi:hypothetical protein
MDDTSGKADAPEARVSVQPDEVIGDAPANAGLSTGSGSSGNTSSNIDESALQNLNVRLYYPVIGHFGSSINGLDE